MFISSILSKQYLLQVFVFTFLTIKLIPSVVNAGITSARLQCQYSFLEIPNLIQDPSCTLQSIRSTNPGILAPPPLPTSPSLSAGPLTAAPDTSHPWSYTPGWTYNPMFSCCSYSPTLDTTPDPAVNETESQSPPTLLTSVDLSASSTEIDQGQQQLELSISFYTSDIPNSPLPVSTGADTFRVLIRFLDATGAYMSIAGAGSSTERDTGFIELRPGDAESLLYYAFDAVTLKPVQVPVGTRGVVLQLLVPYTRSFCFDYFALRLVQGSHHPTTEDVVQKILIGLGSVVLFNAAAIPIILFYGLPGWLWHSAPVNFFQKNPVVDHYVPLALFISTCQWIYNVLLQYMGGSSSTLSIVHSPQALWLIPLLLVGTFFVSAFAHWSLFLCYNQVMRNPRQQYHKKPRRWRAPFLGLWASMCLLLTRIGVVFLTVIQGGYWSIPIGILLAVPETIAMTSVIIFFIKTIWLLTQEGSSSPGRNRGISNRGAVGGIRIGSHSKNNGGLSRSSSMTPLCEENCPATVIEDPMDDLINLSSFHHKVYVKSLLTPERDLRDAAGSMYGRSTIGSNKTVPPIEKISAAMQTDRRGAYRGYESNGQYAGSTLNTTLSSLSSMTEYSRHLTEYDFNISEDNTHRPSPLPSLTGYANGRSQFPFGRNLGVNPPIQRESGGGRGTIQYEDSVGEHRTRLASQRSSAPASSRSGGNQRPPMYCRSSSSREALNAHKLTWNSATTSYTTSSAAQPMTGASPTPSAWEYVVYPQRHVWPSIVGTYLLIARLPLRILVAVLTTFVLCYDVILSIGAAETVLAIPVSCLLGGMAYPGVNQFDNTMNVARAMHTVNLLLVVVLLPIVVFITVVHQVRMIQKYNWCLRLLRVGNYGFVPGGRDYKQHLKHPVRFIGYTVGFGVVGLCFTIFLLFTLCTIMAMLLVAATFRSSLFRTLGSRALAAIGISCSLVFILWLIQMLVIRYRFRMPGSRFFLVPQQSARTGFHHWEFFWAFFNIVFGAFSFFKRIALSVLSMGIYSTRIDLCIMGGRFRPWDGGYSAFVGLVLADHVMNNPIVLEFVQILRDLLLARRNPHLAHLLEAKGRTHPDDVPELDEEAKAERNKQIIMIMNPVRRGERYPGARRPLTNIEEDDEAKMEDLLVATSNESGIGVGAGGGLKGGLVVPEVSKIHHYFRVDQRVDRHKPGQGPASRSSSSSSQPPSAVHYNSDRVSKVYTPLLVSGEAKHQIPITPQDPESVVSQEQIRQTLSEAKLRSIRNRNRWFLYVTLVRNPSIRPLRRTKIKDFLHPIGHGAEYTGSHLEEMLTDIHWDQED